jgi:hypothetical protein
MATSSDPIDIDKDQVMTEALQQVLKQASQLSIEEQLSLIAYLAEQLKQSSQVSQDPPNWFDLEGAVTYPFLGEDAQTWVTRSRQESDAHRELIPK